MIGPIISSVSNPSLFYVQEKYKTSPGVERVPLPYHCLKSEETTTFTAPSAPNGAGFYYAQSASWCRGNSSMAEAEYSSWQRLVSNIDRVEMGMNLATLGQTVDLFATLAKGALSPLRTMATFMKKAAKSNRRVKDSLLLSDVPGAFLAFKFGVEPIMTDLWTASLLLKEETPVVRRISGSAKKQSVYQKYATKVGDWNTTEYYNLSCRRGCTITVSDPNAFMMNQWGLINPAVVVWDLVPFSFVLNWFWPIGAYMASFSDLAGLSITDAYTTRLVRFNSTMKYRNDPGYSEPSKYNWGFRMKRELSLLPVKMPNFLKIPTSAGKISTMGMLVLQQLSDLRIPRRS